MINSRDTCVSCLKPTVHRRHDMARTPIPRFLLPQLTWKSQNMDSARLSVRGASSMLRRQQSFAAFPREGVAGCSPHQERPRISPLQLLAGSSAKSRSHGFHVSARSCREHHFDTLKVVKRLEDEGFTEQQAEAMVRVLSDVIEERYAAKHWATAWTSLQEHALLTVYSIQNLTRTMVLREDQERTTYTQKVDFAKLRSELVTMDASEFAQTRASHDRLANELEKLRGRLRDEIARTQASVRLDLNLEKGRIREESNVMDIKLKETETRIEQESAILRERLEQVKFSTLQWLMSVLRRGSPCVPRRAWLTDARQGRVHWHGGAHAGRLAAADVNVKRVRRIGSTRRDSTGLDGSRATSPRRERRGPGRPVRHDADAYRSIPRHSIVTHVTLDRITCTSKQRLGQKSREIVSWMVI